MKKGKLDNLCNVFIELTEKEQEGILKMSKSLLKAQKYRRALLNNEGINFLPVKEKSK